MLRDPRTVIRPIRVLAVAAFAAAWCLSQPAIAADAVLGVGSAAPAVTEPTAHGTFESTTSVKPFVLEFFAVWCPHCQRETAVLNQLQRADGDRIDIIAVPASPLGFEHTNPLTQADVDQFAKRFETVYRIGFDGHYAAASAYGLTEYPTIYVVNAARHVVAVETGEVPFEELDADVTAALAH
jgi:thiol-disulfide isomerase/thioredoxin